MAVVAREIEDIRVCVCVCVCVVVVVVWWSWSNKSCRRGDQTGETGWIGSGNGWGLGRSGLSVRVARWCDASLRSWPVVAATPMQAWEGLEGFEGWRAGDGQTRRTRKRGGEGDHAGERLV